MITEAGAVILLATALTLDRAEEITRPKERA